MKAKTLCLTLLLMLTALCALTPRLLANEGDWTETTDVQWWWKYVRQASVTTNFSVDKVNVTLVRSDKTGYVAHQVTFTITNQGRTDYKGGDTYLQEYGFCDPEPCPWKGPSIWRPSTIARGTLAAIPAGRSIQISAIAYTPENSKYDNYVQLTVGQ